jgi:hypothetical protein
LDKSFPHGGGHGDREELETELVEERDLKDQIPTSQSSVGAWVGLFVGVAAAVSLWYFGRPQPHPAAATPNATTAPVTSKAADVVTTASPNGLRPTSPWARRSPKGQVRATESGLHDPENPPNNHGSDEPPATTDVAPMGRVTPLPQGVGVPKGRGLLEIIVSEKDKILIDGLEVEPGTRIHRHLKPGKHEIRSQLNKEQPLNVMVREGKRTLVDLSAPKKLSKYEAYKHSHRLKMAVLFL